MVLRMLRDCGVVQISQNMLMRGVVLALTLVLTLTLGSCLKVGLDLSTEPPQVPGFKCKDS